MSKKWHIRSRDSTISEPEALCGPLKQIERMAMGNVLDEEGNIVYMKNGDGSLQIKANGDPRERQVAVQIEGERLTSAKFVSDGIRSELCPECLKAMDDMGGIQAAIAAGS